MQSKPQKPKYCIYQPGGSLLTLRLTVDQSLVTGGDFKIYLPNTNEIKEQWKMAAEDGNWFDKNIYTPPKELHMAKLVFGLLCCSKKASVYSGILSIEFFQNGQPCHLTEPLSWTMTNISPCAINRPTELSGSITFIARVDQ